MAIVMSVAAVDTFFHFALLGSVGSIDSGQPSKPLRRLPVTFGDVLDVADNAVRARRMNRDCRPRVQAKNILHTRLLQDTYQSSEKVGDALAAAGVAKGWSKVAGHLQQQTEVVKGKLDHIVYRRNQIVHEGDLRRLVRPRLLTFNTIAPNEARDTVDFVETLLDAFDKVVSYL
ncbi:MAG: hypothetical protein WAW06_04530 [bacterium]